MYAAFFGLRHEPFSIAPDPRYLFMSERHREALAHLLYGVQGGGGFVLLSGEIGAGKTTVCRCFLEQIPAHCQVAYIFNPRLTVIELLKTVCEEFRIPAAPTAEPTVKHYVDRLNAFLLESHAAGRSTVLIIDEAQNLAPELLEQLRLLTNLETNERKLLQIVLIGQPELREMLARPELEQLAQRVIARYHLGALSADETAHYVRHRLGVAGAADPGALFDAALLRRVHRLARGVPRRINLLCDRALLGAYAQGRHRVDRATLARAAAEVFEGEDGRPAPGGPRRLAWLGLGAALLATAAAAATALLMSDAPRLAPASRATPASAPLASSAPRVAAAPASAVLPPAPAASAVSLALRNERDAWRELARAWGAELPESEGEDPCPALKEAAVSASASAALRCFRSEEGLALLRQLGRPAILTLDDGSGRPAYVLLTGLAEQEATVRAGGAEQRVGLLALGRQWRGKFATLWRTPPGYGERLEPGVAQDWVAARLEQLFGDAADTGRGSALRERIAAFQRAQGLKSDGRAGPITLMQLNRAAGVDEPRLQH